MSKLPVFEWFLARGDVHVTIATAVEGVEIPQHLKRKDIVDFVLGSVPTPQIFADKNGIEASMRFGGELFLCRFPWESVLQMISQEHDAVMQFRGPVMSGSKPADGAAKKSQASPSRSKGRGNLRLVK